MGSQVLQYWGATALKYQWNPHLPLTGDEDFELQLVACKQDRLKSHHLLDAVHSLFASPFITLQCTLTKPWSNQWAFE